MAGATKLLKNNQSKNKEERGFNKSRYFEVTGENNASAIAYCFHNFACFYKKVF